MSGAFPEASPSTHPARSRSVLPQASGEEGRSTAVPHRYAAPAGAARPSDLPREQPAVERILERTDWPLVSVCLALSLLGGLAVYSTTHSDAGVSTGVKHLLNLVLGLVLCALVSRLDIYRLRSLTPWFILLGWAGLVLVLLIGSTIAGAKSWIVVGGGLTIQPTEFMKIALCLGLGAILSDRLRPKVAQPGWVQVVLAWALVFLTLGLVMLQPDLGSGLVITAMGFGVVALSGANRWWILSALVGAVTVATVAITSGLLAEHQMQRLTTFLHPEEDASGAGYQVIQSKVAVGSGGLFGQGFLQGAQAQGGYLPVAESDFIFAVVAEEFGLVGGLLTILLVAFVVLRALQIAQRTQDVFPRLVAIGIACWFGVQTFENVGMTMGLMPMTGVPLPFVSYGGSSMFACWIAVGLLNALAIGSRETD
ncbi:rod shape-determining protein RodA [Kytococcus sp. Marseille-QA3725]